MHSTHHTAVAVGYTLAGIGVGAWLIIATVAGLLIGAIIRRADREETCCPSCGIHDSDDQ